MSQGPKNLLEIRSIRGVVCWEHLWAYVLTKGESALRIKEISVHQTKLHLLKYQTLESLNVLSACGLVVKKDKGVVVPTPLSDPSPSPPPSRQFMYYDLSFLMINKLHIVCHDLFDEIRPGRRTLRLTVPDLVLHRHELTKKYSKEERRRRRRRGAAGTGEGAGGEDERRRKIYSVYELPLVIAKRATPTFLRWNKESVLKIISSGVLDIIVKRLWPRRGRSSSGSGSSRK
jgi:hypothetical protein